MITEPAQELSPGEAPTHSHLIAQSQPDAQSQSITIRPLRAGDDATAFRTLNEEWISRHFTLEPRDRETLNDPETTILRQGGHIFLLFAGSESAGCVALIPMGSGVYELSKMAIAPHHRGQGLGRQLLNHAIAQARLLGATSLFLGSSTKLTSAVRLYESVGFRHVPPDTLPPSPYTRANVFMTLPL